ncbi:MAG: proline dehydrogenase family protein [Bryobacteraceae bacterium]
MLRRVLLYFSQSERLRRFLETSPAGRQLSARFVAGLTLEAAVEAAKKIQVEELLTTLDHLGENVTTLEEAAASRDECIRALQACRAAGMEPNVSIKLSQFGIDLDEKTCRENLRRLVEAAVECAGFVRVDMESSAYTERTLRIVTDLHERYAVAGTVIQAYLRRSEADIEMLCRRGIRVRLCKGAYLEPGEAAFQEKEEVDQNYVRLMKRLLDSGIYHAIATHDEKMIDATRRYAADRGLARTAFEFQMLYGIRRDLQKRLAKDGYRIRLYVPYGSAWYPYFMRRLAERPANILFLVRNLVR